MYRAAIEIALAATGGVVIAAAGAHFIGNEITSFSLQTGAIAGAMRSSLIQFADFASRTGRWKMWLLGLFAGSSFGIAAFIATITSQRIFGHGKKCLDMELKILVKEALLVASLAGAGALYAAIWARSWGNQDAWTS